MQSITLFMRTWREVRNFAWHRFRLQNNLVHKIRKKTLHYLYNSLVPQTISMNPEPKFQVSAPPSKSFWLRLQLFKIASAPGSSSTALLCTRLIHISPSYWTIYRSFEIIFERELSIGLEFKSNVLSTSIASKTFSPIWIMFQKYLIA